ncbi:hypothetical protein GF337_14775 [candidate division KSB1 bacterium]|nr:hypothetical protein [candidate division KSB1 bacterium]
MKNGIKLAREFFWRNSFAKINLNIEFLEIPDFKSILFFEKNGSMIPEYVQQDLNNADIDKSQYGIVILIYPPPIGGGNYGISQESAGTGFAYVNYPVSRDAIYPGASDSVNYHFVFPYVHTLQQGLDVFCYKKSGISSMWNGDQPIEYAQMAGSKFSYQAEILRNFNDYLQIKEPWGEIREAVDFDGDQLPDKDPRLPFDELRFGSDSTSADSDGDGHSDFDEFISGIYRGSDPNNSDSDDDSTIDGDDRFPLNKIFHEVNRLIPDFEGELDNFYLVSTDLDFSTYYFAGGDSLSVKFYTSWDDRYLYISTIVNAPVELHLDLDLNNDGWWNGRDNLRIVADPFSSRLTEIRVMDATERARTLSQNLSRGDAAIWDDEPEYITRFGHLIDERDVHFATKTQELKNMIKIAIPANNYIDFKPESGKKIGVRACFTQIGGHERMWATIFEHYSLFEIILK